MAITYGYDKKTDYKKLMDEAVKAGDYARAAIYEQQRNEKIAGEGLTQYGATNQYSAFLPGSQKFENPYKADLDAALGRLQDKSAYEKAYLREADRTMEDTLSQYGTMTGGIPSTQAVAAASQASDYYKSQLPEKLADLDRQNASLLLSAGSQAQSEYQAMISQALSRWSQLGYADDSVAQILGVKPGTPTSDQAYLNWQKGQQEKSDAYTMAMTMLQTGQMPNADTLAAAGITAEDAQNYINGQNQQSGKTDAYNMAMLLLQAGQMPNADTLAAAGITTEDAQNYINGQNQQSGKTDAYNMAMLLLQAGKMPSAETLAAAGISTVDAESLLSAYTTPSYTYSGGGGSGGGGSNSESSKEQKKESAGKAMNDEQWEKLQKVFLIGKESGDMSEYEKALNALKWQGYDTSAFRNYIAESYGGGENYNILPPTDENILALGFGPISAKRLMELIDQGIVGRAVKNGREVLYLIDHGSASSPAVKPYF